MFRKNYTATEKFRLEGLSRGQQGQPPTQVRASVKVRSGLVEITSICVLEMSEEVDSTASLDNLFQC